MNRINTDVTFGKDARAKIKQGIDLVSDTVKVTIGAKGRNVFIDNPAQPKITNDGVTIASAIIPKDREVGMGAWIAKNTASKTNEEAGDGTTTTTILLQAIVNEALKMPENPMDIMRSLKEAGEEVVAEIKKQAKSVSTIEDVEHIATISAESKEIGKKITDIIEKLGNNAVISVDYNRKPEIEVQIADGYEIKDGHLNPYFATNLETGEAIHENIPVLVSEKRIDNLVQLKSVIESLGKNGANTLAIFCTDIDTYVLNTLISNKVSGTFNTVVVRTNIENLEDIASITGAVIVSDRTGLTFGAATESSLGIAKKVVTSEKKTLVLGKGSKLEAHIAFLRGKTTENSIEKQRTEERIAKLTGGVAIIYVGAPTDSEQEYLKLKIDDAVNATKSAIELGTVDGGGMTLYRIAEALDDTTVGKRILKKALKAPLMQIIENAGKDPMEIISKIPSGKGYNALTEEFVTMAEVGIIDPAKVEIQAVINAISSASVVITTDANIIINYEYPSST